MQSDIKYLPLIYEFYQKVCLLTGLPRKTTHIRFGNEWHQWLLPPDIPPWFQKFTRTAITFFRDTMGMGRIRSVGQKKCFGDASVWPELLRLKMCIRDRFQAHCQRMLYQTLRSISWIHCRGWFQCFNNVFFNLYQMLCRIWQCPLVFLRRY